MRERLFRGKRVDNGEWVESGNINTQTDMYGKEHTYIGLYETSNFAPLQRTIYWVEVDPETVGQFTGLTDKNVKKIFEGDIVRYTRICMYEPSCYFHKKDLVSLHLIYWNEKEYAFEQRHYSVEAKRVLGRGDIVFADGRAKENIIELIGNIHDNPELWEAAE